MNKLYPVWNKCSTTDINLALTARPVRKVWSHFEYIENRSRGLDVIWQPPPRPYCALMNSHSPVGLVSWQWDAVDWACVLCDRRIHDDRASKSANLHQCACPFYSSRTGFFFFAKNIASPRSVSPLQPRCGSLRLLVFLKAKIAVESEEICECDSHTIHQVSQRRLTADWLALWENDCSRISSKVSSDLLPIYIKATRPVLEIFKTAGYFPDRPRT